MPVTVVEAGPCSVVQLRKADKDGYVAAQIGFLHHRFTAREVSAERAFLKCLGGGCHIPVGARAWIEKDQIRILGMVAEVDGRKMFRGEIRGASEEAEKLGHELAERLLKEGADRVLDVGGQKV